MVRVEICANSVASAVNAMRGGADRIELCQNLAEGGVTPSAALIDYCVSRLGLRTHVLVRPRPGDFCYSEAEQEVIAGDILAARRLGASAVVVGCLTREGRVDRPLLQRWVDLAGNMEVTFHRAFDLCSHPEEDLQALIDCGCRRVLTSGQAAHAFDGRSRLGRWVRQVGGRIDILAGCGITPENVRQIVVETGVTEVHGSCKHTVDGRIETDCATVRRLVEAVSDL